MVRRDGRVAEGARLESVYTLTGIGGSNPSLSARLLLPSQRENTRQSNLLRFRCHASYIFNRDRASLAAL